MDPIVSQLKNIQYRIDKDLLDRSVPGIFIYAILWPLVFLPLGFHHSQPFFSWTLTLALAGLSLLRLIHKQTTDKFYAKSPKYWLWIFTLLSLSQAGLWGLLLCYSFADVDLGPLRHLVALAIGGITNGAMLSLMPRLGIAHANILLILGPAILLSTFFLQDFSMSILLLVYLLYLVMLGRRAHGEYIRAFEIEIELESRRQELEISNKIDPLTQIYNRGHFNTAFKYLWAGGIRNQQKQSLLLIDIDHFKSVNDRYGHLFGDECLIQIATTIHKTAKRDTDLIARFGGEEFAVLLSHTSLEDGCRMAESIRRAIEKQLIQFEDIQIKVTASIGVSNLLPNAQTNPNQLIDSADKALYLAKDEGRNCVRFSIPR